LEQCLRDGGDVNATDDDGKTPLHVAAGKGNLDMCLALLSHGAYIDAETPAGQTPLDLAATYYHYMLHSMPVAAKERLPVCAVLYHMGARPPNLPEDPSFVTCCAT
jgi:hypothetical protein